MNCEQAQRLLSREHDAQPIGRDAAPLAAHVQDCPACARFQASLSTFGGTIRQAAEWEPPARAGVRGRALDRWAAAPSRRGWPFHLGAMPAHRPALLAGAAAALLAALLGLANWQQGRDVRDRPEIVRGTSPRPRPVPIETPDRLNDGRRVLPLRNPGMNTVNGIPHDRKPDTGQGSPSLPSGPVTEESVPRRSSPPSSEPSAPPQAPVPDEQFLDGRDPSLLARWNPMNAREQERLEMILWKLPPPADDFVRVPFPLIAAGGDQKTAMAAAVREYQQKAKIVDPRLFRKVTLQLKGASLADFSAKLQEQTGVDLRASRGVADEKVTVFVKDQGARDVMRAVARLFGYAWVRSGEPDAYRYELEQDLKSRLREEELRNRDANAALLELDAEMEKYHPYLHMPYEQLQKLADQTSEKYMRGQESRENALRLGGVTNMDGGWAGMQLYLRLSAADRASLSAGHELAFRPDAADPDRRFPPEVQRSLLQSYDVHPASEEVSLAKLPGARIVQVRLRLNRSELGQVALQVLMTARWPGKFGESQTGFPLELLISRSPAVAKPENARANAVLRGRSPFDTVVTLRPEPSCPTARKFLLGKLKPLPYGLGSSSIGDFQRPHVFTSDVWEELHRKTGLPIVADYYTRMHRLAPVTVTGKSLFEALCTVSDAMGVRWKKEGDFVLGRSTSYFWDRLKEIPNRLLHRWIADRDAHGGLPLADMLEMASLPDQQLDSVIVNEAITHCLGLRDWGQLRWPHARPSARLFAALTPDQQRRAFTPDGVPIQELSPAQKQVVMQFQHTIDQAVARQNGESTPISPENWRRVRVVARFCPAGWYQWTPPDVQPVPMVQVAGRTAAEALAAARRMWSGASPDQVKLEENGYFWVGLMIHFGAEAK
jgi:hypothetical protein